MNLHYSSEKNIQILIALLKAHDITNFIVSPGSANANFVISIQQDPDFKIYSCIDERSAAYMACGLAAETKQPVAICCTGATASRNYMPGLTEAYYRKLPVIAITATRDINLLGMNRDQLVDRTVIPHDIAICSVHLPIVKDADTEWECMIKVNKALLELKRNGGGPVHINLTTSYSKDFSVKNLPSVNIIDRFDYRDKISELPDLPNGKIAVFVGSHDYWSEDLTLAVDAFCENYNAVVLCDHNSNYRGKYGIFFDLLNIQGGYSPEIQQLDTIIHLGDISASGPRNCRSVWRVNPDGELRDTYKKLKYVFQMEEQDFFIKYNKKAEENTPRTDFYNAWQKEYDDLMDVLRAQEDQMPFSSIWVALNSYNKLPGNSVLHLAILNSLRSWNFFGPANIKGAFANTGGFGIDGCVSTLIGASLANTGDIYYLVTGDLAFFYDMNALGNRHIGPNVRIILVNNGLGSEFKNNLNPQQQAGLGDDADPYVAAKGHYGKMSHVLVKNYVENLGFKYLSANNKQEFLNTIPVLFSTNIEDGPLICELFINEKDDVEALKQIEQLKASPEGAAKQLAKSVLGDKGVQKLKHFLGKD